MRKYYFFVASIFFLLAFPTTQYAQTPDSIPTFEFGQPKDYEIGGITVVGAQYSDDNAIKAIAGLAVGDKVRIPGQSIPKAMRALWKLRLFTDINIYKTKTIGDVIFLEIAVKERPRLSRYSYEGVKKSYHDDLNDVLNNYLLKGAIVTENIKVNARNAVLDFFIEKGYLDAEVVVKEVTDEKQTNAVRLVFDAKRNDRVKIKDITFTGNDNVKSRKLRSLLDETKRKRRLFASSKLIKTEYEKDKKNIAMYYNTLGFRDAQVVSDSIYRDEDGHLMLALNIDEGNRYYFRDISWKGNSIYETEFLTEVLGIGSGDTYNQELLETRLRFSQDGRDISALYMDNGYLFFRVEPTEIAIDQDSIDLEIRIFEGPQATIDKVAVIGNDRTHDHVIIRELRTRPGQKFSRSDIMRSQREIIALGYFNPESLTMNTPVNENRGTVDIEYVVEEKPSDQLELSAGWAGGGRGVIGTLGVSFNNFSLRNIFDKKSWSPLPQGDGQRLSLRAQTNGNFYQSYNVSFTEPWLGGKKPNSLTVSGFLNRFAFGERETSAYQTFSIKQFSVGLGTRLKWPDDNFIGQLSLNIQNLSLNNWTSGLFQLDDGSRITNGSFNNFSLKATVTRSSIGDRIFPKDGASITFSAQLTPPYSLLNNKNYTDLPIDEKFKFLEYHKYRLNAEWYTPLFGKFVLKTAAKIGMLGFYNSEIGSSPFERFQLGGDGFSNQQVGYTGVDLIALRGYDVPDLPNSNQGGATVFDKFTVELRYPISLNPNATIYVLGFVEGGNSWRSFRDFNPFDLRRSSGMGLRVFLPMFGTLGFDYGMGFDKPDAVGSNIWNKYGRFSIILGFEPE